MKLLSFVGLLQILSLSFCSIAYAQLSSQISLDLVFLHAYQKQKVKQLSYPQPDHQVSDETLSVWSSDSELRGLFSEERSNKTIIQYPYHPNDLDEILSSPDELPDFIHVKHPDAENQYKDHLIIPRYWEDDTTEPELPKTGLSPIYWFQVSREETLSYRFLTIDNNHCRTITPTPELADYLELLPFKPDFQIEAAEEVQCFRKASLGNCSYSIGNNSIPVA